MKITIESTSRIVQVATGTHTGSVSGRVWQGTTDTGIPVTVCITSLAVPIGEDQSRFQSEFQEHAAPNADAVKSFPLRFVI